MSWLTPCAECGTGTAEAPILTFQLCAVTDTSITDTPVVAAVPVNTNGTLRGSIIIHDLASGVGSTLTPLATAPCCCQIDLCA